MSATIEIRTSEAEPFIILPTVIDGKGPFSFVLDTGANVSIMTDELARSLEIRTSEVKEALGAGGRKVQVSLGRASSIAVGGASVEGARVGIMQSLPKCVGEGVLGYDFLRHYAVTIDYHRHQLTLAEPGEQKESDVPGAYMPLRLARPDRPVILMDVHVNERKTYQFILDTGASRTVVSPLLAQQMDVRTTDGEKILGASGVVEGSTGTLQSLRMGDVSLADVHVMVSDVFAPLTEAVGATLDGIIGYNVLRHFKLTIDYPNEKLHLQKA